MSEGTSVWKALGITCGVITAVGACGVGGCFVIGMMAATGSSSSGTVASSPQSAAQEAAALPWLAAVRQNCERYEAAPNEIQKSDIFNENEQLIHGQPVEQVRGELRRLQTAQGGGGLTIEVQVGEATFKNGVFSGIAAGSSVYQQASSLREGQCVVVSGTVQSAASVLERSKVCDLDYDVTWSSIAGCAQ